MIQSPRLKLTPETDETLDGVGDAAAFLQKKKGQRLASDDILLAAMAVRAMPNARTMLDLGTGKGSVALMSLSALPKLSAVGVEAFDESFRLAVRNARLNQQQDRFTPMFADIRSLDGKLGSKTFDLITGAPPFMKVGHGVMPQNKQRQYGRFELRGGIEAYCAAVGTYLNQRRGKYVLLMDARNESRTRRALSERGLHLETLIEVLPRPKQPPIYQIFVGSYTKHTFGSYCIAMRSETGDHWTEDYAQLRTSIGLEC